jgi:hypothetical protein
MTDKNPRIQSLASHAGQPASPHALYVLYNALARHPGNEQEFPDRDFREFVNLWRSFDLESQVHFEEKLRKNYKNLLKNSVDSGMDVVGKYLRPDRSESNDRSH